jgi:hypothetical protein
MSKVVNVTVITYQIAFNLQENLLRGVLDEFGDTIALKYLVINLFYVYLASSTSS